MIPQQNQSQSNPVRTPTPERPVLVLLHGFGEDSRIWDQQQLLATECHLLTPDLPGTRGTAPPPAWTMDALADFVKAQLDREGIEKIVLVGHSMGGYVALAFAERWPERLLGLGLFHSTAFADTEQKKETRRKGIAFIKANGATAFLRTSLPGLYH